MVLSSVRYSPMKCAPICTDSSSTTVHPGYGTYVKSLVGSMESPYAVMLLFLFRLLYTSLHKTYAASAAGGTRSHGAAPKIARIVVAAGYSRP